MNKYQNASAVLKNGVIYIFSKAIVDNRAFTFDRCLLVTENLSEVETIGAAVRQALKVYGRPMTTEEFHNRPDPILSVTGDKSHAKLNRGAGRGAVGLFPDQSAIDVTPYRTKGRDAFPMVDQKERISMTASDHDVGATLLRVLAVSQLENSPI